MKTINLTYSEVYLIIMALEEKCSNSPLSDKYKAVLTQIYEIYDESDAKVYSLSETDLTSLKP